MSAGVFTVRCQPGIEGQVESAVRQTVNDPDIWPPAYRFGDFDEAPLSRVETRVLEPGTVEVAMRGNIAYFDGEVEIMASVLERAAAYLRAGLW